MLDDQAGEVAWIPAVNVPSFPNDPNRLLNSEIEPPSIVPTPPTPEQTSQLSYTGSLSQNTITRYDTEQDISIFNLPVGTLFREYYNPLESRVWPRSDRDWETTSI